MSVCGQKVSVQKNARAPITTFKLKPIVSAPGRRELLAVDV